MAFGTIVKLAKIMPEIQASAPCLFAAEQTCTLQAFVFTQVFSKAMHCKYTVFFRSAVADKLHTLDSTLFGHTECSWYDAQASRPKLALWHSARERAVWMRDIAAAQVSQSAAELAYLAAVLSDK